MISIEQYMEAADYLRGRLPAGIETAVVLGSGLGKLTERIEAAVRLPYADIPHFPRSTVASHAGVLVAGALSGRPVAAFSGRFHYYEGYSMETVAFYVRVLHLLGVRRLILTNAAGGVNERFQVGDLMLITDHIKLTAETPSRGTVPPAFGARFFDMTRAYTPRLLDTARDCGRRLGIPLREGTYFFMAGPQFETPAEIRAIRILGGDAVGMSTVAEAIAASQCGMEVLGISCITNMAAGVVPGGTVSDDEVTAAAALAADRFCALVEGILESV